MRTPSASPVDLPCDFLIDEMFFSSTDLKGIIQAGNAVFARVSGYSMAELVGQPHNVIRHPDMPCVVFRLLWDYLHRDQPVAALVKNLSKDGCYYWVIALVTPIPGGYLSVRFKPSTALSEKLQVIYGRLRAIESTHEDGGAEGRVGMDAAQQALGEELNRLGFADYDGFMQNLLHEEMKSRDALIGGIATRSKVAVTGTGEAVVVLRSICDGASRAYGQINSLYASLDELTSLHKGISEKAAAVLDLTQSIRFVALSTAIKAAQLGDEGRSLGVIAQFLNEASAHTSNEVHRLRDNIKAVTGELHAVIFNLAGARLQLEMMMFFGRELLAAKGGANLDADTVGASREGMIGGLQRAFHGTMVRAVGFLATLGKHLGGLQEVAVNLRRTVLTLHIAQVGGKIEASRIAQDDSIVAVLVEIHTHIESTARELDGLGTTTARFAHLIAAAPAIAREIYKVNAEIERNVQKLPAKRVGDGGIIGCTDRANILAPGREPATAIN